MKVCSEFFADLAHHAKVNVGECEIYCGNFWRLSDKYVSGVRVSVKEPGDKELFEGCSSKFSGHRIWVDAGFNQSVNVRNFDC